MSSIDDTLKPIEPAEFLHETTDEVDQEDFIRPNIETKLSKEKRTTCRDIIKEINMFGVDQRQKLYLIYLLALELENREAMLSITKAVGCIRDKVDVSLIQIPTSDKLT